MDTNNKFAQSPFITPENRTYKYQYQEPPYVIHRSLNKVVIAGRKNQTRPNLDGELRGWKSP